MFKEFKGTGTDSVTLYANGRYNECKSLEFRRFSSADFKRGAEETMGLNVKLINFSQFSSTLFLVQWPGFYFDCICR